ncbi:hypothetical protein [Ornithinimicrobium kibberense]|uniref:hypothetical protein n=1 Tax=Ornithinimicrobium kibberense TaxID=282060 RepID=UPI00192D666C|nr:hypothetical protein [Ornithinimicrobium kibberense]
MPDHLPVPSVPAGDDRSVRRPAGPVRRAGLRGGVAAAAVLSLVLAACSPGSDGDDGSGTDGARGTDGSAVAPPADPDALVATLSAGQEGTVVLGAEDDGDDHAEGYDPSALALATADHFFTDAPVVVLTSADKQLRAASAAVALGVPVLVDGPHTSAQLDRLGTEVALVVGAVADPGIDVVVAADDAELASLVGATGEPLAVGPEDQVQQVADLDPASPEVLVPDASSTDAEAATAGPAGDEGGATAEAAPAPAPEGADQDATTATADPAPAPLESDRDELPVTAPPPPLDDVLVLSTGDPAQTAAVGTARAAGAQVVVLPGGDPGASSESLSAFADAAAGATSLVGLGAQFGDPDTLDWQARVAATGVELPGGGLTTLPGKTYVALYGTPSTGALGVLGEQPIEDTITRAQEHASWYEPLTDEPVVPTLEIIATVASAEAGPDGNYSNELPVEDLRPLVELAAENGVYVVLDLQPGRTDFVEQAQIYEELLRLPHVGLALDPEWRLGPDEVHMVRIGSVETEEVDRVVDWMAELVREHDLPQKMLVLHQFQIRMIPGADDVDRSRPEVAVLIHADGQGPHGSKMDTWTALQGHAPGVEHWGWKNFYDEDVPGPFTPEATMQVEPTPDFISYQ